MPRTLMAVLSILIATGGAGAQATNPFLGTWKVTWEGEAQSHEALLVVAESGGSWKTSARQKNNPCVGREVPIKIESSTPAELKMVLQFSAVISGCNDSKVTLNAGPGGTVTGKRGKADLVLVRDP